MIKIMLLTFSNCAFALSLNPTPFPIFLKAGFSAILEFEEAPTQVVLGDVNGFQVEKLKRSIVIKPNVPYATTNMFVYFKHKEPRLFVLTASEDVDPTFYKKFESPIPKVVQTKLPGGIKFARAARLSSAVFNNKKDYLTVEIEVSADSTGKLLPSWDLVRLQFKNQAIAASKLWSERKEVQKDSKLRARFIFVKPNIPKDLKGVSLVVPVLGSSKPFHIGLNRRTQ